MNWWQRNRPSIELYFSLWPIIRIQTAIMRESIERFTFEYCRLELWLFKHRLLAFNLYRRAVDNVTNEPRTKLSQRLMRALSLHRRSQNAPKPTPREDV